MTIIPLYNVLALPESNLYLKTDLCKRLTGRIPRVNEKVVLLILKENRTREDVTSSSFYPIGLTGVVTEVNPLNGYLVIRTRNRVNVDEVNVYGDHTIDVELSRRRDVEDADEAEENARIRRVKAALVRFADDMGSIGNSRSYIAQLSTISEVASAMSPWMLNASREKYAVLEEDSVTHRNTLIEKLIFENLEMSKVNQEAKSAQEEDYQKIYRESAIKKQMEYLQKELDEMHPNEVSDIRRFELAIEESGMNDQARAEAEKVLNRLRQEGKNSPEAGMLYDYLDFLTSLPWRKEEMHAISLPEAEKILDEDHYGLTKVKKRILQQIAVMNLKRRQSGSILCFVGAPGTGKTSIGQSIAKALQREYVRVSLGGVRDEADIRGHRRTYIGAMAGRIMDGIKKSGVTNPVMVLDEVDKLSMSYNGDPASALLEVLDPEQNNTFTDHYMNVPYDLSDVLFICTANSLDTIPAPLLDRMEVISFQGYTQNEKMKIGRKHLLPRAMEAAGLEAEQITVTDDALECIISDYTREGGVRGLKKCLDMLARSCAVRVVNGESGLTVTRENVREFMDVRMMRHQKITDTVHPGVVTGLAWTPVGGEILSIETLMSPGKGNITITGQLGDVMKESAQIATSLVRFLYPSSADRFEKENLHIHVPDGATPKDGPSAGITMTTALASLVTGIPVSPQVGMTGEVSLQGLIKPIGGLPEKLMAADRAGVTTVFIPKDNEEDLEEVPQEVRDHLTIRPVSRVTDVLGELGLLEAYEAAM